ncbi:MAG: hypothetical protein KGJ41_12055 [Rhodospirillales bacterium]|nr:hypothetical protein [Rhodospirillales bacterium]MDE2575035.1 hypothetical protein [Rhodospirillales bacterium]
MFYNIRNKIQRAKFNWMVRGILTTPPQPAGEGPGAILSVVSAADIAMYLVAVKSLHSRLPQLRIIIIDDGTLHPKDRDILSRHLPGATLIARDEIVLGSLPPDLMWQRLACVIAASAEGFVIQLDSDTVTIGAVDVVRNCIEQNRSFIMATQECPQIQPLPVAVKFAEGHPSRHIQIVAEQAMANLPGAGMLRYIRGSAGFFGLAPGAVTLGQAEELFARMDALTSGRFLEWGAEQFGANFLVANTPEACALPYPGYAVFDPGCDPDKAVFLHFIGAYRFDRDVYAYFAQKILAELTQVSRDKIA